MGDASVSGTITSVVYRNAENGYSVLRCNGLDDGGKKQFTAVGTLPDVLPGEDVELTGAWGTHSSYGEQFNVESYKRRAPEGSDAIFRYLSSGAIRGVGPGIARAIVAKFGERTLEVIETSPERLAEIRGVSPKHAREIAADFRRTAGLRRLVEFLGEHGVSPLTASRLYKDLGDDALDALRENPYIMASSEYGAKFSDADRLAYGLGFPPDATERVEAALLFEARHNLNKNGHVFLPADKLAEATAMFLRGDGGVDLETVSDALDMLTDDGALRREDVANKDACYLPECHEAETYVAARVKALAGVAPDVDGDRIESILRDVERREGVTYADGQREAVVTAARSRVMALTGGPGTGKTTSVRAILALYDALGLTTLLCAPTGRAAKRMGELTGRDDAMTVHRALGAQPSQDDGLIYERGEDNPLKADAVVVDESSMLDLPLTRALLAALPDGCRLLLVGDENQLPSVGPGNVLSDILRSGVIPVVTLTEIFRQARESGIVRAAHMVNRGETPDFSETRSDMFFLKRTSAAAIAETVADLVSRRLPENMNIPASQIQVLTPTRRGEAGTANLNFRLQAVLNPHDGQRNELSRNGFTFREGDRVMQVRNNYDIMWTDERGRAGMGVYNGDLGFITRIDFAGDTMTVDFEDKLVVYAFSQLDDMEPAYAMTVHKSQGSEYRAVVLALPPGAPRLTTRAVLYTAITRARELLVCAGDPEVFDAMVRNNRRQQRYSGLRHRLGQSPSDGEL